jgi:hypothetical protein
MEEADVQDAQSGIHAGVQGTDGQTCEVYNRRRRHSTLGYASPQQFLNDWVMRQHEKKLAA